MKNRIAIIGAGLAGLTIARKLSSIAYVKLFEKSRGVGGRMSTRYAAPFYFDHGAQFFTARHPRFQRFIEPFIANGDIAEWKGKVITFEAGKTPDKSMWFEPHYVASPHMNSLCRRLSENLDLTLNTEVAPLGAKQDEGWHLFDQNGAALGWYDWVISTAPPAQTERLFGEHLAADAPLRRARLSGCYTLMIGLNRSWDKRWIAATIRDNPLAWLAVNSTKPGRDANVTCLVAHSTHAWAEAHIDDDMPAAQAYLMERLENVTEMDFSNGDHVSAHRWRYANLAQPMALPPYMDRGSNLAAAGDWCEASRVEDVWLASESLADSMGDFLRRD